jgi:hypothetical protein
MENNFLALVLAMHSKMLQDPCLEAISLLIQGSLMMQLEKLPEAEKVDYISVSFHCCLLSTFVPVKVCFIIIYVVVIYLYFGTCN